MGDNPFANTPFAAFGGQIAQFWQTSLETWWKALLSDQGRLTELAKLLSEAGLGGGDSSVSAESLAKVLEGMELMQARMEKTEARIQAMAETVAAMVSVLESLPKDAAE